MPQQVPSFYFGDKFSSFEPLIANAEGSCERHMLRGDLLTRPSDVNNTAFYVRRGIMQFGLLCTDGTEQTVALFGPGQVFPIGVTRHDHRMDYDMVMRAYTQMDV